MRSHFLSPLRYPGGKASLAPFLARLVEGNGNSGGVFIEPFGGGAGAALCLLVDEYVDRVVINDLHSGIAAMWRALLWQTEEFLSLMYDSPISVDEWQAQRSVCQAQDGNGLALGFATFYLNRTNRSGILGARPIGGLGQRGKWRIDARFNKRDLERRIRFLAGYRNRIEVSELNAVDLLQGLDADSNSFVFIDPPYLKHGKDLYLDSFSWQDHINLASTVWDLPSNWVATYDFDIRVTRSLYSRCRCATYDLAHTAAKQHIGSEFAVFSDGLRVCSLDLLGRAGGEWWEAQGDRPA